MLSSEKLQATIADLQVILTIMSISDISYNWGKGLFRILI
jgi:hypothetical protein